MLDSFVQNQSIVYKILTNSLDNDKLSHAYLFETNGNGQAYDMAIAFSKSILCPNKYINNLKCVNCTQCNKIDRKEFSEFVIIEPDGMWIKKEQLDMLQKQFETKGIESEKRVYIINHAEKLNIAAANSILKFLEEPESNIIAILITDNRYQLLDTIVSRCQIVSFHNSFNVENNKFYTLLRTMLSNPTVEVMNDDDLESYLTASIEFVKNMEEKRLDAILYTEKYFHHIFSTKDLILFAFDTMILYYKDVIQFQCGISMTLFDGYIDDISKISLMNSKISLLHKINTLLYFRKFVYVNANTNLLIDRLIIELNKGE